MKQFLCQFFTEHHQRLDKHVANRWRCRCGKYTYSLPVQREPLGLEALIDETIIEELDAERRYAES